jgi:hypothetical protein
MHCGDALLIPANADNEETPHLWVIVTEPDPLCAIVCFSTLRYSKDQTVVLRKGEHTFINRDTAVLYMYAEISNVDHLRQQIADGCASVHDSCHVDVLKIIQDGMFASPFTPRKIQNFCRDRLR